MDSQVTKELIFDHFRGDATVQQRILINKWLETPQNEEVFYKYLLDWELAKPQYEVDTPNAIEKYRSLTHTVNQEIIPSTLTPSKRNWLRSLLGAAACIAFTVCLGWFFKEDLQYATLATNPGEVRSFTLSDGTVVTLNANSNLRYDRWNFNRSDRKVILHGEAEFNVTHKKDNQEFMVKTGNRFNIVVLGTVFSVYNRNKKMQVTLNKGSVRIEQNSGAQQRNWIMTPGEVVTVEKTGTVDQKKIDNPKKYAPWKDSRFEFDKSSLKDIAQILKDNYDLKVVIENETLSEMTISGSFKAQDASELLNSISQLLEIQYKLHDNTVHFYN